MSPSKEPKEYSPIKERSWKEFRESGLFWWINMLLHTFGWVIVVELNDDEEISRVFPAKTTYRGFSEASNTRGYENITNYMVQNSEELLKAFPKEEEENS